MVTDMRFTKTQHRIYDVIISSLAFVSVIFFIVDFTYDMSEWQIYLHNMILAIFVMDYSIRFYLAKNKKRYIKENMYDLIAIIPIYQLISWIPKVATNRSFRLINGIRIFAFLHRPFRKAKKFLNTNGFKYVLFLSVLLVITGGILIHYAEGMSITDGIWWAFVTSTTVGYGDISPNSLYGRLIAMVLMLLGIGLIGSVTSTLTAYFLGNKKESDVESQAISMVKDQLDRFDELSDEDINNICKILKALRKQRKSNTNQITKTKKVNKGNKASEPVKTSKNAKVENKKKTEKLMKTEKIKKEDHTLD